MGFSDPLERKIKGCDHGEDELMECCGLECVEVLHLIPDSAVLWLVIISPDRVQHCEALVLVLALGRFCWPHYRT